VAKKMGALLGRSALLFRCVPQTAPPTMKSGDRVIIAGASGLVGRALVRDLVAAGVAVRRLVRRAPVAADEIRWSPESGWLDPAVVSGAAAVVNLAGENIAAGRWTEARKTTIRASREQATRTLALAIRAAAVPPRVMVNASAVGIYAPSDGAVDEQGRLGEDFLAGVCRDWERAALAAAGPEVRVVWVRLGVVLDASGGALARMLPVFRLGLGGRLGRGAQWMSWISLPDAVAGIRFALEGSGLAGPVNLVAPEPVTNAAFTVALGRALRRPTCFPVPAAVIELLFGEMGRATLLASTRVVPGRLVAAGFIFRHPTVASALAHVLCSGR
jgi:uncharacterized protein (TIGR01777 family)